ncbi:sigma-54-dependent Fis family transcriptional regulator [Anaeromyxobacter diazotrophicus]|uniref:Sigma-54-dependent Fis family transcriptional regulator n=1 Tax=Anaeromyxobacter diazotrophicus TaxID=2590199 RepID=A0A7I9VS12_9BACT|nr:sigma-54-dependent Fis family transcriptional regulator [Anaeromyxobacter diazotrophicus]GEJ58849.1 sigma-54-dependent Fis family transcriptional regulator [Anaeromyxobacter diazotrophicus]
MRAEDLDLRELLSFESKGGIIRFGGERALILDAVALGLLRKELIDSVGLTAARGVLTRFGYAHGWRTAESMRSGFPWQSEREWRVAGGRLHMLNGSVVIEQPAPSLASSPEPFVESIWHESYEAEQHLLHLGQADEPVCWTLAGFASGYLSFANGREVYCLEDRCRGKGDATCHLVGRLKEEWGPEVEPQLAAYRKESVDAALEGATAALRAAERRLKARRQELARIAPGVEERAGLVVKSEAMHRVVDLALRVAKVGSTALVTGESGVGKERLARIIHDASPRAGRPFVAVNCGAVTETLLESELFGHARGAFTGADREHAGLFESANGGTLFLDEIGEISPGMQVKLLRVLQEREVRRVGENRPRPVDVRVVAATNRDLAADVAAKAFRQDLYYRLRVIELRVPPLRERPEDVLPLGRVFLADTSRRMGRKITGFTPRAADQLVRYEWPGNVRELQNAVEHAVALSQGSRIEIEDLPEELRAAMPRPRVTARTRALEDVEREYILAAVESVGGNRTRAAADLGIGLATLKRKLKRYGAGPADGAKVGRASPARKARTSRTR